MGGDKWTVCALLLVAGCARGYGTHYSVYVNPNEKSSFVAAVQVAATDWEGKTGVALDVRQEECPSRDDGVICVEQIDAVTLGAIVNDHADGVTLSQSEWDGGISLILEGLAEGPQHSSLVHELGHAMGLVHDSSKDAVMYYEIGPGISPEITVRDVQQWEGLRQ